MTLATRKLERNHLPNCVALKNLDSGSEDITILENGLAFISTGLKYPGLPAPDGPGKIFTLDLQDSRLKPVELRMPRNFDLDSFNPHGISVYTDPSDDAVYLFVVNHPEQGSQVELFKYLEDDSSLVHLKTIKHELLHSVNDIVAVGADSFYATNDRYFSCEHLKGFAEFLLGQPWTNVVYYSPEKVQVVSEGYYVANGINISPDKRHVYVADVLGGTVHLLERKEDNSLTSVKSLAVGTLPDNIEVDPDTGDLWIGCHPNAWKVLMFDPQDPAGSEVIRIQNFHSEKPTVTQVYADDGGELIGSSVAATYAGKLLIGSVFHKALHCDLDVTLSPPMATLLVAPPMAALGKALLATLVVALAVFIGHRLLKLKEIALSSREVPNKHLKCRHLDNIEYGSEDITIMKDGMAFISTGLKYPGMPSFSDDPGRLYMMDLLHPKPAPVELRIEGELDLSSFNPHGISVYTDETDDSVYLFVVNHPRGESHVEIFRFVAGSTLLHLKTVTHPLLHSVNDIVAVGVDSFYATNDHSSPIKALHYLSIFLGLPGCDVVYYSPGDARVAASGFGSSNGINVSPDRRYIYVSDILDHEVDVFERKDGERLQHVKSVNVGSLCDNIEVDPESGDVWLGCHPNGSKLMPFNPEDPPGSEVVRVKGILSRQPRVTQVYADDGRQLMASSVAAVFEGKLLIGSVFQKALYCDLQ
ncbi:uncharacterized protein ACB057_014764 [Neosynchiropus ocellatus]